MRPTTSCSRSAAERPAGERVAPAVAAVHVIELDERLRPGLEELAARERGIELVFGDAMDIDLAALDPPPTAMVSNLPYSIATPLLLRTIAELPGLRRWTVMVQREIADRLGAAPRTKAYGSPSVLVQLACRVRLLRAVDPRCSVRGCGWSRRSCGSTGRARGPGMRWRGWCAARSHTGARRSRARSALQAWRRASGRWRRSRNWASATARAEELAPADFAALAGELGR